VYVPQINFDIYTGFTLSSAGSAPDHQKYPVEDINEPTSCTLLYVKRRTLRTTEVVDAIVMATHIMHGRPIPSQCVVIELTIFREGHEFDDLDCPDEEVGIEKLKGAKGNFILWLRKYIIPKTRSSSIVSPQNREDESTRTSQNIICSTIRCTPLSQNPPQTTHPPKNPSPTQPLEHHSPPLLDVLKSPPQTTPRPRNPPPTQPLGHHPIYLYSCDPLSHSLDMYGTHISIQLGHVMSVSL
jgi:hypothetical protein